jgi:hypothetical protein
MGYLIIGQSESLYKITTIYDIVPMGGAMLYQKQAAPKVAAGGNGNRAPERK